MQFSCETNLNKKRHDKDRNYFVYLIVPGENFSLGLSLALLVLYIERPRAKFSETDLAIG